MRNVGRLEKNMMSEIDDWGCDPSVRTMRRLFSRMESAQKELLEKIGVMPFDGRLRQCREEARILFERALSSKAARAGGLNEDESATLYTLCLSSALDRYGIQSPVEIRPGDTQLEEMMQEALK